MPDAPAETTAPQYDPVPPLLAPVESAVRREHEALLDDLQARLFEPLRTAIDGAAQVHRDLMEEHGLAGSADDPADALSLWARLRAYRQAARAGVMEPLHAHVAAMDVRLVPDRWQTFRQTLLSLADELPEHTVRPEPADLYAPIPGDRWWWRLAKQRELAARRIVHGRRRAANRVRRLVRREPLPLPDPTQQVPLQRLMQYHLSVRLPDALEPVRPTVHEALAHPIAVLEHALTTWTHALLQDERRLARSHFHLPDEARGLLPGLDDVPAEAVAEALSDAQMQARVLQQHLEQAAAAASVDALRDVLEGVHATTWGTLLLDVDRAGTFMLKEEDRQLREAAPPPSPTDAWNRWHREAADRLRLDVGLLRFSVALQELQADYVRRAADEGLLPVLRVHDAAETHLRTLHDDAEARLSHRDASALTGALQAVQQEALDHIEDALLAPLRAHRRDTPLQQVAEWGIRRWTDVVRDLPTSLQVHPLPPLDEPVDADAPRRELRPREAAEQALDALLLERLRTAVAPLQEVTGQALREAEQLPSIIRFNLDAAHEELPETGAVSPDTLHDTRELALNGLARPAEVVTGQRRLIAEAVPPFLQATGETFATGWERVHGRLRVEDRVQEQLMDLRSRLRTSLRRFALRTRERSERSGATARRLFRFGRRRAGELVRLGQSAVGTAAVTEAERHRALRALADAEALVRHFPLVYRRLFSFQPVTDSALLAGRGDDLERVRLHVAHWMERLAGALVLTGPRDGGMTSFLHVAREQALQDATVHTLTLTERLRTEEAFAAAVANVLQLSDDDASWTLDRLAQALADRARPERPEVLIVEHLEHLFLRVVKGTRLLEAVLTLMSRTDAHLLWIATLTDQGGRFVRKTEPASTGLVRWHALTPLGRDGLEEMVMRRHRRSGLPLTFEASEDLNPIVRRRLKRARTDEERQELLRAAYFDRLHRLSGSSLTLALFYWLRSAELDAEHHRLRISPVTPLQLNFLADFDLEQAFTLKAFLDHTTLTLAEHAEIFRTPLDDSQQRFEALSNVLLIESVDGGGDTRSSIGPAITEVHRYRLRPLTIHPVTQYLARRHITY